MIRSAIGAVAVLAAIVTSTAGASAMAQSAPPPGPFEGTFRGTVYSPDGSSAPLEVQLTHRGRELAGTATLGDGLEVRGGFCGAASVPAATEQVSGQTTPGDPRHVAARATFDVHGIPITVTLDGTLSPDGETVTARSTIDLPFLCGRDPVLTGTLARVG